jgi:hypothetical protein
VLPGGLDRALAYVGLSRHRERVQIYAGRDEFKDLDALKAGLGRWTFKQSTLDYARNFVSSGLSEYRNWVAEENRRRQEAFAADRAAILDTEGWEKQKEGYKTMSARRIVQRGFGGDRCGLQGGHDARERASGHARCKPPAVVSTRR